jgi:hypothetical protein
MPAINRSCHIRPPSSGANPCSTNSLSPHADGWTLTLSRYTHPEPDHKILLEQLKPTLPAQPPPRISSRGKLLNQN